VNNLAEDVGTFCHHTEMNACEKRWTQIKKKLNPTEKGWKKRKRPITRKFMSFEVKCGLLKKR
jgi:hypothetical protein